MQRTVNYTRVNYATIEKDEMGKLVVSENTVFISETDPRKVRKELVKQVGDVTVISTKKFSQLYVMPDAEFLQFAEPVGDPKEIADEQ